MHLYTDLGFEEGQLDCLEAIAAIAADAGNSEEALRFLGITMRAREELGSPLFAPDELAQVRDPLSSARGALDGADIERIAFQARDLALPDAVAAVLATGPARTFVLPERGDPGRIMSPEGSMAGGAQRDFQR